MATSCLASEVHAVVDIGFAVADIAAVLLIAVVVSIVFVAVERQWGIDEGLKLRSVRDWALSCAVRQCAW